MIGKAQQSAQLQFLRNMGEEEVPNVEVRDVAIVNVVNLGVMTEEEFYGKKSEPAVPTNEANNVTNIFG